MVESFIENNKEDADISAALLHAHALMMAAV